MADQPQPIMASNGHTDIIAKLESAKRADRWLDEHIAVAVGLQVRKVTSLGLNGRTPGRYLCFAPGDFKGRPIPRYTASLDAALALVAEKLPGAGYELFTQIAGKFYRAAVFNTGNVGADAEAPTAPLAVLLALFRTLSGCEGNGTEQSPDTSQAPGMNPNPNPTIRETKP